MKAIFKFVKVRLLGDCMVISIPSEIRREAGLEKGDQMLISYNKMDGFTLEKKETYTTKNVQDSSIKDEAGAPGQANP